MLIGEGTSFKLKWICIHTKVAKMDRTCNVLDEILEKDIVSWSGMIQGYASNELPTRSPPYQTSLSVDVIHVE